MMFHTTASQLHSLRRNRINPFLASHPPIKIVKHKINPFLATENLHIGGEPLVSVSASVRTEKVDENVLTNEETEKVTTKLPETKDLKPQVVELSESRSRLDTRQAETLSAARRGIIIKDVQEINPFLATRVIPSFDSHIASTLEETTNNFLSPVLWNSPSSQNEVVSYTVYSALTSTTPSHLSTEPTSTFDTGHSCGQELKTKKIIQKSKCSKDCNVSRNVCLKCSVLSQGKEDNVPQEFKDQPEVHSRYDTKLDVEPCFSATQESIANEIVQHCKPGGVLIDAFCGCGVNAIQFARRGRRVIAIDIDPVKVEYAKHNARIYGVTDLITFVIADFMAIGSALKGDVVFLSPPWGGSSEHINNSDVFNLETMIPFNGIKVFETARLISPNIIFFLPRHVDINQLKELAGPGNFVEIRKNYIKNQVKAITAYYGSLVDTSSEDVAKGQSRSCLKGVLVLPI